MRHRARGRWKTLVSRDRPITALVAVAMIVSGISVALTEGAGVSLIELAPLWVSDVWGAVMALAGIAILVGLTTPNLVRSVAFKASGEWAGGLSILAYATAVAANTPWGASQITVPVLIALGCGLLVRAVKLSRAWNREIRRQRNLGG